jgi:hypothetical protein
MFSSTLYPRIQKATPDIPNDSVLQPKPLKPSQTFSLLLQKSSPRQERVVPQAGLLASLSIHYIPTAIQTY